MTILRRGAVTLAFLAAMVGTAIGVGAVGGDPIAEAAGGLLAADSTPSRPGLLGVLDLVADLPRPRCLHPVAVVGPP